MIKYSRCVVYWLILLFLNLGNAGDNLFKEESVTQTHTDTNLDDIRLTSEQKLSLYGIGPNNSLPSNDMVAKAGSPYLWPNGLVLWKLSKSDRITATDAATLRNVLKMFQDHSCVRFVEVGSREALTSGIRPSSYGYLDIKGLGSCHSYLGRSKKFVAQEVSLEGCNDGVMAHEMMHALGFYHEHTRSDRDSFVKIHMDRVEKGRELNFRKQSTSVNLTPYDESSIMHYKVESFSNHGKTIEALEPDLEVLMGQRIELTHYDYMALHDGYRCAVKCIYRPWPVCEHDGFWNKNCRCVCPKGLTGKSCTKLDPLETEAGCGGIYKNLSSGESYHFGTESHPNSYKKCAWIFSGPRGSFLKLTVPSLNMYHSDDFEIRWNLPGQKGPKYTSIPSYREFSTERHRSDTRKPVMSLFLKPSGFNHRLYFKAKVIAVGGNTGRAPLPRPGVVYNDFELDFYGFRQEGEIKWKMLSNSASKYRYRPSVVSGRSYAYAEGYLTEYHSALLTSDILYDGSYDVCINFARYLFGPRLGKLEVLAKSEFDGKEHSIWNSKGGKNAWLTSALLMNTDAAALIGPYRIQLKAKKGNVAIDDVLIGPAPCHKIVVVPDCKTCKRIPPCALTKTCRPKVITSRDARKVVMTEACMTSAKKCTNRDGTECKVCSGGAQTIIQPRMKILSTMIVLTIVMKLGILHKHS